MTHRVACYVIGIQDVIYPWWLAVQFFDHGFGDGCGGVPKRAVSREAVPELTTAELGFL